MQWEVSLLRINSSYYGHEENFKHDAFIFTGESDLWRVKSFSGINELLIYSVCAFAASGIRTKWFVVYCRSEHFKLSSDRLKNKFTKKNFACDHNKEILFVAFVLCVVGNG